MEQKGGREHEPSYIGHMATSAEPLKPKLPAYVGIIISVLIGINPYLGAAIAGAVAANVVTWRVAVWERRAKRILRRVTG